MWMDIKEKLKDPDVAKIIPMVCIIITIVMTVIICGIRIMQLNKVNENLQVVEKQYEDLKEKKNANLDSEAKSSSALNKGTKVANLQTDWSRQMRSMKETTSDTDKAKYEAEIMTIEKDLKAYFSDDSYDTAWFPGKEGLSAVWNFGTKYNVSSDLETVPVVWVCYDNSKGPVLAYTTALFDVKQETFSDAKTIVFNVDDIYNLGSSLTASVLDMLQADPIKVTDMHQPLELEWLKNPDVSDTNEETSTDTESSEEHTPVENETEDSEQTDKKPNSDTKYSMDEIGDVFDEE